MELGRDLAGRVNLFVSPEQDGEVVRSEHGAEGPHHLGLL